MSEILRIENVSKRFAKRSLFSSAQTVVDAAYKVGFALNPGEVFVLAGESGSGKSTVARIILQALRPDTGEIFLDGAKVEWGTRDAGLLRRHCQMIQQDPYDSINPRMRVRDIVSEPLEIHGEDDRHARDARVLDVLREVRLEPAEVISAKYPHMLSGGQRQRVVLARALAPRPRVIIADEPVSMLDVSVRAEMLELFDSLRKRHGIAFLYITHDLATARYFGDQIAIMYRGMIVETGKIDDVLLSPRHPYTAALIDAISEPDPKNLDRHKKINILDGDVVSEGCRFRPRCPYAIEKCASEPGLEERHGRHLACFVDI